MDSPWATELRDVAAGVIFSGGEVLACRRRSGIAAGGFWEFPGGKLEPGESAAVALARELREELGVEVTVGEVIVTSEYPKGGIRLIVMAAELTGRRPERSADHDALEWLGPDAMTDRTWAPADRQAVELVVEMLRRARQAP